MLLEIAASVGHNFVADVEVRRLRVVSLSMEVEVPKSGVYGLELCSWKLKRLCEASQVSRLESCFWKLRCSS